MRILFVVEDDIFGLCYFLRPEVLVNHLFVEAKRHTDHEVTQFIHLVNGVFVEVPAVEYFVVAVFVYLPDVVVILLHWDSVGVIRHEVFVESGGVRVCVAGGGVTLLDPVERVWDCVFRVAYFTCGA